MIFPFNPFAGSIVVTTRVFGSHRELILRFLLDTGATSSAITWQSAEDIGYNPAAVTDLVQTITANGMILAPRLTFERIETLGQERRNFPMLCHPLPPGAEVDGVLGLDFLRGHKLTIDFRIGLVTLE
jgi:clan AA aspartic protease (TIGR02281 family)